MTWIRPPAPRTWLALLAGLIWALAFPTPGLAVFAWIAPGLLWLTGVGVDRRTALWLGYVAGLLHHLVALRWLLSIPFPFGNVAAWLALSGYCALFTLVWMGLGQRAWKAISDGQRDDQPKATGETSEAGRGPILSNDPFAMGAAPLKLRGATWSAFHRLLDQPWWQRQLLLVLLAAAWAGLEFLRGWFLSGFPWNFLGASQYRSIPLIQIAGWTGVHGVTFVMVWVSLALALGAVSVVARPQIRFAWTNEVAPALISLLLLIGWGIGLTLRPPAPAGRTLKLALVQPSIPQTMIFDSSTVSNRFEQLLELTRAAVATRPDLVIWPEASLPMVDRNSFERLRTLIREAGVPLILGTDDAEPDGQGGYLVYNAAFVFDSDGRPTGRYRKQRLVILGEYTPGVEWFPFLANWSPAGRGFSTGTGPVNFHVEPAGANVEVNICFEDNFAGLVRRQVRPDTDFLLNLTNNGWFGEGAAQWQHAANAVFRTVENGIPLVRCTNNGLTCWIDEQGRLRQVFRDDTGSIHGSGVAVFELPLPPAGSRRSLTVYGRWGDWFGWTCLALTVLAACSRSSPQSWRAHSVRIEESGTRPSS